jgi:hypothetical protein
VQINVRQRSTQGIVTMLCVLSSFLPVRGGGGDAPGRGALPDLVVSKERLRESINIRKRDGESGDCTIFEGCLGLGKRRTLEFDTYVVNAGDGDLRLGRPSDRPNLFEYSACHGHYHLKESFVYGIALGGTDSVGLFDATTGTLVFRNENSRGPADGMLRVGAGGLPIAGDWSLAGPVFPGSYDPATGRFSLLERPNATAPLTFTYAPEPGPLLPVAGDWNGDGRDTVGVYSPATRKFYLKAKNGTGRKATTVTVGVGQGDWLPIAGDWDGDGVDTVGLYDRATGVFALRNSNASGPADVTFAFGAGGAAPLAGDWDRDGTDTVGVYDAAAATFALRNANEAGEPDAVAAIDGAAAGLEPVAGDWDYEPGDILLPGRKEAFCWIDSQRISGARDLQYRNCDNQGLTAGWCDIYIRNTDCQWIDITDLEPGVYQLTVTVNAARLISEADTTNNSASVKVRVPGARVRQASPKVTIVSPLPSEVAVGQPVTITWRVTGGPVTRQELWLVEVDANHPSKVQLIADDLPAGARSYTWVPSRAFQTTAAQLMVRAQNDDEFVGDDARSAGIFRIRE